MKPRRQLLRQVLEQMQQDLSSERTSRHSAEMQFRQLQLEHHKLSADFEDLQKRMHSTDSKINGGSFGRTFQLMISSTTLIIQSTFRGFGDDGERRRYDISKELHVVQTPSN